MKGTRKYVHKAKGNTPEIFTEKGTHSASKWLRTAILAEKNFSTATLKFPWSRVAIIRDFGTAKDYILRN
jgi:hypothetical protein